MSIAVKNTVAAIAVFLLSFSGVKAASADSTALLQYIPADTPYVLATTAPLPSDLADKLEPAFEQMLKGYQTILQSTIEDQLARPSSSDPDTSAPDTAEADRVRDLMEEVLGLMSLEGLRGIGIERDSAFALYGNGALPVIRLQLSESDLFDAAIKRIEEKAGHELSSGVAKGAPYKYMDLEGVKLIVATLDDQAVLTAVPSAYDEAQLARVIGVTPPRQNLKRSKKLQTIGKQYGFSDFMTGFVDTERLTKIFSGDSSAQEDHFFTAFGQPSPELSKVCRDEMMETAGIAPRIVFGYTEVSVEQVSSAVIVELRDDIAAGLSGIPAAVPGLGVDDGGFMSLGLSLNPQAARSFYEARLDAMDADPYECEMFAGIQAGARQGRAYLEQPLPPILYSFRGVVVHITDLLGFNVASGAPPESVNASILLAVENAQALLAMGALLDPQIEALNLQADGKPVKLEIERLSSIAESAFVALSSGALAISWGEGAESNSADMLVANSASPAPFISMSVDAARYFKVLGDAMLIRPDEGNPAQVSTAVLETVREIMMLSGSLYERMSIDIQFTDRGIELNSGMTLSD